MKKTLVIAAVTLASASAFASKARLAALQNADHLSDIQDVLTKPGRANNHGEWATLEFGSTAGTTTRAEGGFMRKMGEGALGAYLGGVSETPNGYRGVSTNYLKHENPLRVFYATKAGDLSWGVGFYHTSSKNTQSTASKKKQDAMGLTGSVNSGGDWEAYLGLGLSNTAEFETTTATTGEKFTGTSTATLGGTYAMDTMTFFGEYTMGGFKHEINSSTKADRSDSSMKFGVVNSHKKDGTDFFYGISYTSTTQKDAADTPLATSLGANIEKKETTTMPIIMGIEAEATSWMVLRGSITQNMNLLGMAKTKTTNKANTDNNTEVTGADNTTINAGAGIKWAKFTVDGTVAVAAADGAAFGTNGGAFLSKLGMTYMF